MQQNAWINYTHKVRIYQAFSRPRALPPPDLFSPIEAACLYQNTSLCSRRELRRLLLIAALNTRSTAPTQQTKPAQPYWQPRRGCFAPSCCYRERKSEAPALRRRRALPPSKGKILIARVFSYFFSLSLYLTPFQKFWAEALKRNRFCESTLCNLMVSHFWRRGSAGLAAPKVA